jgi:hypothetical protein
MAKALFGHLTPVGHNDPALLVELATLRRRVAELEASLVEVREERDALMADGFARTLTHLQSDGVDVHLEDGYERSTR